MGDHQHRALIVVERIEKRPAAVDIEVVGRFVEDQKVRAVHRDDVQQQAGAFATREVLDLGLDLFRRHAEAAQARAAAGFGLIRPGAADHLQRRVFRIHGFDLVLVEPGDRHAPVAPVVAVAFLQRAGQQLGEGRLAGAVDAQHADAVIGIEARGDVAQDDLVVIADADIVQAQDRRRQFLLR